MVYPYWFSWVLFSSQRVIFPILPAGPFVHFLSPPIISYALCLPFWLAFKFCKACCTNPTLSHLSHINSLTLFLRFKPLEQLWFTPLCCYTVSGALQWRTAVSSHGLSFSSMWQWSLLALNTEEMNELMILLGTLCFLSDAFRNDLWPVLLDSYQFWFGDKLFSCSL